MPTKILDIRTNNNNESNIIKKLNNNDFSTYENKIIIYMADFCGYCKIFKPMLDNFLNILTTDKNYKKENILIILASDITSPLLKKFNPPKTYPTISYYKNDKHNIDFDNEEERNIINLKKFVNNILNKKPTRKHSSRKKHSRGRKKHSRGRKKHSRGRKKHSRGRKKHSIKR
jgi:thiol-disulfide isomerase/thioredoxin